MPAIEGTQPYFPPDPKHVGWVRSADGLELFVQEHGPEDSALTPVVCCNGVGVSIFFWHYLVEGLSTERRVILWDYAGHGRSQEAGPENELTVDRCTEDLARVLDDRGIEKAVLLGHSMGVQCGFEAWRRMPQRVAGLVPILGTAGRPLDTFGGMANGRVVFDLILPHLMGERPRARSAVQGILNWRHALRAARLLRLVHPRLAPSDDVRRYMSHLAAMSFNTFTRMVQALGEHNAWDVLPTIEVPVLVVAGERDSFSPPDLSRKLADAIPTSELLMLPTASHAGLIEQPETINLAVRRYLRRRVDPASPHPQSLTDES